MHPKTTKTFFAHLKDALEHWHEPAWLGATSPLATPYFLGARLHGQAPTAAARGAALQAELDHVLATLWREPLPSTGQALLAAVAEEAATHGRGDRYDCLILELNYRKAIIRPAPKTQAEIYHDILHISRPTHDRHLAQAVEQLGTLLLQRLRPAMRPEQPPIVPTLIGREQLQAQLLAALHTEQAVSLTGAGGVGKSTLAAAIAEAWSSPAIFWFTFRLTFNDQLASLLFALGHFLHSHGASTLWHQLVADGGRVQDRQLALGLVRTDLAALPYRPLLCFDELDVLRPVNAEQPAPHHAQLLEFIDSLRGFTPLLLIGQRAYWESDQLIQLEGLAAPQVGMLLQGLAIPYTAEELARLHFYSGGNPRLVSLCAALYHAEGATSLQTILAQLPTTPTLLPLWHRLARRLSAPERQLLQLLAVFRTPAPVDAWQQAALEQTTLAQLVERRLCLQDEQGGVAVLPALREVIYSDLVVEQREQYHLLAAAIRAERGEYTAAAYHLVQADQPDAAVTLWYAHRQSEINRGQASAALAIFEQISLRRLTGNVEKTLRLLRAELYQLVGAPERVVATLSDLTWANPAGGQVDVALLLGKALDQQGHGEQALATYAAGIEVATGLLSKVVQLHVQRSLTYLHERDLTQAWQEVNRARYLAANMVGTVHEQAGDLAAAQTHYQAALAIAQESNYLAGVAKTAHNLGNLASRQRAIEPALAYYTQALETHHALGDRVGVEVARSGLVTVYMQAARYQDAIGPAHQALAFFRAMGDSFWTALNASNLAEAYTELGELAEAETHATLVLDQEEPHSHPYALFTLGRIRQQAGQPAQAELYLQQARAVAELNGDRFLLAYCWEELGKIYQTSSRFAQATAAFTTARTTFTQLNIADKIAELTHRLDNVAGAV